ncbi:MAG TPA: PilZ domain-containing protein [Myxococcales bacterium]|jgi:hypothetical protein
MASNPEKIRDRRANGRIAVGIPVELQDESFEYLGTAVDLSPGGLRVRMPNVELALNSDYDVILKPPGEPPMKLKGRVMHLAGQEAGIALATGDAKIFETALSLYESVLFKDPKLALRLKKRPSSMEFTQRLWPLTLEGAVLSGPEHWIFGNLKPSGTSVAELKQAVGAEWSRLCYVPFMLVERGLASLTEPAQPIEDVPGKPIPRQQTGPFGLKPPGSPTPAPGLRKPGSGR